MDLGIENLGVAAIVVLLILDKMKGLVPKVYFKNGNGKDKDKTIYVREPLQQQLGRLFESIEEQNEKHNNLVENLNITLGEQNDVLRNLVITNNRLVKHLDNHGRLSN